MQDWSVEAITDPEYRVKFLDVPNIIQDWTSPYGGLAGKDILDFGCGEGTMAMGVALRHGAARVVGVEIQPEIEKLSAICAASIETAKSPKEPAASARGSRR